MRNKRRNVSRENAKDKIREENLPLNNFIACRKMSIHRRFEFALAGYRFTNNPDVPAIELCTTRLNAPEGMQRGVKVGKPSFFFLPTLSSSTARLALVNVLKKVFKCIINLS